MSIPAPTWSIQEAKDDDLDEAVEIGQVFLDGRDDPVAVYFRERGSMFILSDQGKTMTLKMGNVLAKSAFLLVSAPTVA